MICRGPGSKTEAAWIGIGLGAAAIDGCLQFDDGSELSTQVDPARLSHLCASASLALASISACGLYYGNSWERRLVLESRMSQFRAAIDS
jgi:hypothetical protein